MIFETLLDAIDEARKRRVPALPNGDGNLTNIILKLRQGKKNYWKLISLREEACLW